MRYFIGIGWFVISLVFSNFNDIIAKYISDHIPVWEITFFRFFFGTISLIPFIWYKGYFNIKTARPTLHIIRGVFLSIAIFLWIKGLEASQLITATVISFTIPIYVLILASIFLKEKVSIKLWLITILGLIGIVVILDPYNLNFNIRSTMFVISSVLFASLDVINKKYVRSESMLSMLFYSSIITMLFSFFPMLYEYYPISKKDLFLLLILGFGSNAILYCILKAFAFVKASSLAPFRYIELVISITLGYFIFNETPNIKFYLGAVMIIVSSLYIAMQESKTTK